MSCRALSSSLRSFLSFSTIWASRPRVLRTWRTSVAKEKQIPPYMVFSDATLVGIVEAAPASTAQLSGISGVGAKKLYEYGDAVLEVLGSPGS